MPAGSRGPLPEPARGYPPGVTDESIKVGFNWFDVGKAVAVATAAGLNVSATGLDLKGQVNAVVKYFNHRGGIEGREIIPVFHEVNIANYLASNQGRAQETQKTCTAFTEDDHVYAMVYFLPMDDDLNECARRTGTIAFANGFIDEPRFKEVADVWYMAPFLINRFVFNLVQSDLRNNWSERGAKVGILTEDRPYIVRSTASVLKPALQQAGFDVAVEITYPHYQQSPWETYVVQFQTAGVTHVYFNVTEGGPYAKALFMRAAENQGYHPVYGGINSGDLLDNLRQVAPASQLKGTSAMSWFATDEGGVDTAPDNPDKQLCRQIQKDGGQGEIVGYGCDYLFVLARGLAGANEFTLKGFRRGVESIGTSYFGLGGVGYHYTFGPSRHDPLNAVRDMLFDDSCTCYKYSSGILSAG